MKNVQFLLDPVPTLTSDGPQAPSCTNNASYTILIVYTVKKSLHIRVRLTRQCVYMHSSVVLAFTKGNICTGDSILQWIRSMLINTACLSPSIIPVEQIRGSFLRSTCTESVIFKTFRSKDLLHLQLEHEKHLLDINKTCCDCMGRISVLCIQTTEHLKLFACKRATACTQIILHVIQ